MVVGPFLVRSSTLIQHGTLEQEDIGRWYIVVQGCLFLYDEKRDAEAAAAALEDSVTSYPPGSW